MVLHKMFRSTLTVSLMTLLSRITGLIRDIAFAQILGSGQVADAFFVAFRIPNFFRRIFAEGAFTAGFVPVYAEYESRYPAPQVDRKSTRLNSSHALISYAVFCLKKKKNIK